MGGHYLQQQEAFRSLLVVMVVAVLLVFIMLAFQFRSVVLPLLIFLTQPLSLVSGLFALWLTDTPLNVSSYMGAILLIGLDMKNGILLVEYIQQLRREGMALRPALLLAGRTRFRPILMTSLAAILGLVPAGPGHRARGADAAAAGDHGHRRADREHAVHPHGDPGRLPAPGAPQGARCRPLAPAALSACPPAAADASAVPARRSPGACHPRRTRAPTRLPGRDHMKSRSLARIAVLRSGVRLRRHRRAELELVQTIPLKGKAGNLDHLALDAKRDRLLVANKANNTLDVVDLKAGNLLKQVPNQTGIQGVAYAADLDRVLRRPGDQRPVQRLRRRDLQGGQDDQVRRRLRQRPVQPEDPARVRRPRREVARRRQRQDQRLEGGHQAAGRRPRRSSWRRTGRGRTSPPRRPCQVVVIDTEKNEVATTLPGEGGRRGPPDRPGRGRTTASTWAAVRSRRWSSWTPRSGKEVGEAAIPADVDDLFLDAARKRLYASCGEGFLAVLKVTTPTTSKWWRRCRRPRGRGRACMCQRRESCTWRSRGRRARTGRKFTCTR